MSEFGDVLRAISRLSPIERHELLLHFQRSGEDFPTDAVEEPLSPSTQHIDRREKLVNYCRLPSLEECVIARQQRAELEIYRRSSNWRPEIVSGLETRIEFRSLEVSINLAEIYLRRSMMVSRCKRI